MAYSPRDNTPQKKFGLVFIFGVCRFAVLLNYIILNYVELLLHTIACPHQMTKLCAKSDLYVVYHVVLASYRPLCFPSILMTRSSPRFNLQDAVACRTFSRMVSDDSASPELLHPSFSLKVLLSSWGSANVEPGPWHRWPFNGEVTSWPIAWTMSAALSRSAGSRVLCFTVRRCRGYAACVCRLCTTMFMPHEYS